MFSTSLNKFYNEVVPLFGYEVVPKIKKGDDILYEDKIERIKPMDTRHLSVINMIMQGVSPIVIKEFCGHDDIESSMNYYDHLPSYVKCYTINLSNKIRLYRENNEKIDTINNSIITCSNVDLKYKKIFLETVNNYNICNNGKGKCISDNNYEDCIYVNGICDAGCKYYIPNESNSTYYEHLESTILNEVEILKYLVLNNKYMKEFESMHATRINKTRAFINKVAVMLADSI